MVAKHRKYWIPFDKRVLLHYRLEINIEFVVQQVELHLLMLHDPFIIQHFQVDLNAHQVMFSAQHLQILRTQFVL
jgi:hypothetical protein